MAYTSTTLSLAMIEFLSHLGLEDLDPNSPPELVTVAAEIADRDVGTLAQLGALLPEDWRTTPPPVELAAIGDRWIARSETLALAVPSCHLPDAALEGNVLINPRHRAFPAVRPAIAPFAYDKRLLARRPDRP